MNDTLEKLNDDLIHKKISKKELLSRLMNMAESESNHEKKVKLLEFMVKIEVKNKSFFKFLENFLISDENEFVRATAAKAIAFCFPKKAIEPLKWAIKHETSPLVLKTLKDLFDDIEDIYFK